MVAMQKNEPGGMRVVKAEEARNMAGRQDAA